MKTKYLVLSISLLFVLVSCKKQPISPDSDPNAEFKFISLKSADTLLPINGITNVEAVASGSNLTYTWTASYGSFIGSGKSVKWTVCHSDRFSVTCEVKDDKGHSEAKSIFINVQ